MITTVIFMNLIVAERLFMSKMSISISGEPSQHEPVPKRPFLIGSLDHRTKNVSTVPCSASGCSHAAGIDCQRPCVAARAEESRQRLDPDLQRERLNRLDPYRRGELDRRRRRHSAWQGTDEGLRLPGNREGLQGLSALVALQVRRRRQQWSLLFARWLTLFPDIHSVTDPEMDGFGQSLKPGPPPDGQDVLKQSFGNYRAAALSTDPKEKAELMFLVNVQIGFNEQTRLQPDIKTALDGALLEPGDLTDLLMKTLTGRQGRIAKSLEKVFHGHESPLGKIVMVLAHDVQQQVRTLVTEQIMSLWLPPDTMVQLGRDLGRPFPEDLQKLTSPDLLHLLAGFELKCV
jgi:hypothetical protein